LTIALLLGSISLEEAKAVMLDKRHRHIQRRQAGNRGPTY